MPPTRPGLLHLGHRAPGFRLPEPLTGRFIGPEDYPEAEALAVIFLANRCPDVQHHAPALAALAREHPPARLQILGVNAMDDDAEPDEAPAATAAEALKRGYVFPYLSDQSQAVAWAFGTECTPDVFLFDRARRLAYHGRVDASRFGGRPADGRDFREALEAVLSGRPAPAHQVAAAGSPILWREPPPQARRRPERRDQPHA